MVVLLYIPQYRARFDSAWIYSMNECLSIQILKNEPTTFNTVTQGLLNKDFYYLALECCPDFI